MADWLLRPLSRLHSSLPERGKRMLYSLLLGGLNALKDYVALHVLTCLIPAFLLAGGIVTFISREAIIG
jgi:uncharacterized membrane protein YraQ (UPF0718 family)